MEPQWVWVSLDSDCFLYEFTERSDFLCDFYGRREEGIRLISALFSGTFLSVLFSCHPCFFPLHQPTPFWLIDFWKHLLSWVNMGLVTAVVGFGFGAGFHS